MSHVERERKRQQAIEHLLADENGRLIYAHFLRSFQQSNGRGIEIETVEADERFVIGTREAAKAFKEKRDTFLELLGDALPDDAMYHRSKSPLKSGAPPVAAATLQADSIEQLLAIVKAQARVGNDGKVTLAIPQPAGGHSREGERDDESSEFTISRSAARDLDRYQAVSARAAAAGKSVVITE